MYISVYIQRLNFCVQRRIDSSWGRNFQPAGFRVGPYAGDYFLLTQSTARCNSAKFPSAKAESGTVEHSMRSRRMVRLGGTTPPCAHYNMVQLALLKWFQLAVCWSANGQSTYQECRTPSLVIIKRQSETFLKVQSASVTTTDHVLILGASLIWRRPVQSNSESWPYVYWLKCFSTIALRDSGYYDPWETFKESRLLKGEILPQSRGELDLQ